MTHKLSTPTKSWSGHRKPSRSRPRGLERIRQGLKNEFRADVRGPRPLRGPEYLAVNSLVPTFDIGLMDSRRNPGPAMLRHHDAVIGALRRGGFDIAQAATAFSLIDSYLFGFVLQELNLPFQGAADLEEVAAPILEGMTGGDFPFLTEMIVGHAMQPAYACADEFDIGLDVILDGIGRLKGAG